MSLMSEAVVSEIHPADSRDSHFDAPNVAGGSYAYNYATRTHLELSSTILSQLPLISTR
jgi:hypothetical protein